MASAMSLGVYIENSLSVSDPEIQIITSDRCVVNPTASALFRWNERALKLAPQAATAGALLVSRFVAGMTSEQVAHRRPPSTARRGSRRPCRSGPMAEPQAAQTGTGPVMIRQSPPAEGGSGKRASSEPLRHRDF